VGHALPFGGVRATSRWAPVISTFPEAINNLYKQRAAGDDPVMNAALALGAPVHYHKIARSLSWSESTRRVFQTMADAGFRDAVSTPVFAKPGVYAYFAAAFPTPQTKLREADLRRIQICFGEYYFRYRELTRSQRTTLSKREREVLVAIANNKSNAEIAATLGVSEHTVDTYLKRCFAKLDVSNRTEAVIKCFGGGFGPALQV
jgi:DNA-binding CsgD family transcriptional regulator